MPPLHLGKKYLAEAVLIFFVTLLCGYLRMVPGVIGTLHDDGLYVAAGKALAAGQGYILPNLPIEVPQTKYPPLLPLLFALIWKLSPQFPANAVLFQALCLTLLATALGLSFLFLVRFRYATGNVALAACLLAATNSFLLFYGSTPMTMGLFTFLTMLVFWMTEETLAAEEHDRRNGFATGCALALAGLCRSVGFVWIPVIAVVFFLRRRRALLPFLATAIPVAVMWTAWSATNRPEGMDPLISYYVSYSQDWADTSFSDIPVTILSNLYRLYQGFGFMLLPGFLIFFSTVAAKGAWPLLLAGLFVLSGAVKRGKEGRILFWLLCAYFIPIILHPWPPNRFLLPIAPLALALMLTEVSAFRKRIAPSRRMVGAGVTLAALVLNIGVLGMYHKRNNETGYPMAYFRDPPHWSSVEEGLHWLRSNTSEEAVIACWLDPVVWLYTGRKSYRFNVFRPFAWFYDDGRELVEDTEALRARLSAHGTNYVFNIRNASSMVDELTEEKISAMTVGPRPTLETVFTSADSGVSIHRVLP
jgi:hypothetical protein